MPEHVPAVLARRQYELTQTFDLVRRMFPSTLAEFRDAVSADLTLYRDLAAAERYEVAEPVAQVLLAEERLIAPPGSAVRTQLLRAILQNQIQLLEENQERLRGNIKPLSQTAPKAARKLPTMLLLFEDWKTSQTRPRTVNAVQQAVLEFQALHGALPFQAITGQHARDYGKHLVSLGLADSTIANRLGFLATLVRHGDANGLLDGLPDNDNVFQGLKIRGGRSTRTPKDRRAYDSAELNALYQSRLYREGYRPAGQAAEAAYWVPLLGPFLGARIEEVAQLRIEDIERINGVWTFRICDLDEAQQLKTAGSFRRVPLHDEIVKCGFLAYVAQQKRAGNQRVFPSLLNKNKNRVWSNALGKWYGRYLDSVGLSDPRLDYHSHRYAFRQRLTLCGCEDEVRDALSGHWVSKSRSGRTYMKAENRQYPFPKLASAMQLLRYEEVNLEHLYVADPMAGVEEALLRS